MKRCFVFAIVGVMLAVCGCDMSNLLDDKFNSVEGLIRCEGGCRHEGKLTEEKCRQGGGTWIEPVCLDYQVGQEPKEPNGLVECEDAGGTWYVGQCQISNQNVCENLGGTWEEYDYSILDLGGGRYIRRIIDNNGQHYICGRYTAVYTDSDQVLDCNDKEIEVMDYALKHGLCTKETTCQPAYPIGKDGEVQVGGDKHHLAICNSCPLNNIWCRGKDLEFYCKKIDSDPKNCGGCGIECAEGMRCIQGKCEEKHLFMCKDEGNIACGLGGDGVPNCYDPKSMKTCGVICENNTAQFTSCVQNEVCIENDSVYSCQCLLMKVKSQSGFVCGTGEDRRCIQPDADATCGATCDSEGKKCPNHTQCKHVDGSYQCVCTDQSLSIEMHDGNITCINPQKDMTYCGLTKEDILAGKTHQCIFGEECKEGECVCKEGYIKCGDACIDPSKDALHCGASGDCSQIALGENYSGDACGDAGVCENGVCHCNTENGYVLCDGECIDPTRNADYCGASGNCENGNRGTKCENVTPVCIDSVCKSNCPQGQDLCVYFPPNFGHPVPL